jgi:hypothetical protein
MPNPIPNVERKVVTAPQLPALEVPLAFLSELSPCLEIPSIEAN